MWGEKIRMCQQLEPEWYSSYIIQSYAQGNFGVSCLIVGFVQFKQFKKS